MFHHFLSKNGVWGRVPERLVWLRREAEFCSFILCFKGLGVGLRQEASFASW